MFDRRELAALAQTIQIQSPREREGQDFAVAFLFAAQVVACAILLHVGYYLTGAESVYWAIISSILVLQPGLSQSINASATRIAANLIGALTGLLIGYFLGTEAWHVIIAMVAVIFICEPLRLDFGLRTACVSAIIVMTSHVRENVLANGIERFLAVVIGCVLALGVQFVADSVSQKLGWQKMLAPSPTAPPDPQVENSALVNATTTNPLVSSPPSVIAAPTNSAFSRSSGVRAEE
jgi:uncharacterized membrane protein YccC